ncbi:DUF4258 domain-containing protein [Candidatus Woesearchaeota archaeon]|nr:DUF4258 domain-containing protein [Candidatus Woesearchaeota archaeon]
MTDDFELILTEHAKERMAAKGISKEQIKTAIKQGAKQKQTEGLLATYTYLEVAYKIIGKKYVVKTVKIR